jgi:membrane protein DedA with SNARE-associated domain/membrane-associated phospholipid phosphatase
MLSHFVDSILNLPPIVLEQWGYVIVFIFSMIESMPLIGLAIPGGVIVIAAGFFVKIGVLHLFPTIIIVSIGAFLGDAVAYFLGRRFGYEFLVRVGKYIFFKPVHFEKAKKILQTHPRKAILGGRFHALTRSIMPFAAGSADIKSQLFLPFAALTSVLWAIANVLIGLIFGQGFQVASHYLGEIFFAALILSILVVYSYQFISRFTEKNKHVIQRFQIYPLLLNIISIYIVAKISESVIIGTHIRRLDFMVNHFFQKVQSSLLTDFFVGVTSLATPTNLTVVGCALAAYFMYRRRWYFLALLPSSLLAGVISDSVLKKMVHVARPLFPLIPTADFSFPSGHATIAVIFFGLIIYFFKDSIKSVLWRKVYIIGCILAAMTICLSRLYLNAHWLSDVLAGIFLGIFWVTLFIVLFYFFTSLSPRRMEQEFDREIKEEQSVLS